MTILFISVYILLDSPIRVGLLVSVSTSHCGRSSPTKGHHTKGDDSPLGSHAFGTEFDSADRLSKTPGSVWNCLWGHALKRSHGINRKSRVL